MCLGNGERVAVPLADNVYLAEVARLDFPIRLVAYDDDGRVIGIEAFGHDPLASPGPRPIEGKQRVVRRVRAADGSVGTLRLGPSTEGTTCWQISFRDGHGGAGRQQKRYRGPAVALSVDTSGVLFGNVAPNVASVTVELRNGERVRVEPLEGVVLHPLTRDALDRGGRARDRARLERREGGPAAVRATQSVTKGDAAAYGTHTAVLPSRHTQRLPFAHV